ncbi:hypothetical protein [Stenotrophomonas maltophilia]|uniref:hypothetical protein n=1 Tax=Stenotrophomonas maltophilia TaxID=40324 RepID=UPI000AEEAEDE|nr:hypothetical protein [Stenotrophomonas maltophilia]
MQARNLTLVEIGVGALPSASPVVQRFSTWFPVPFKAPDVPPANGVTPNPVADGVLIEWDAIDQEGVIYVIERSESAQGPWVEISRTTETRYLYSDGSGKKWWFRVTPTVRGKAGEGAIVGVIPPTTSAGLAEQQAKLTAEINARIQAIADEAAARAAGLEQAARDLLAEALVRQQGVTEAMQAISAETLARIDAILNEKMDREAAITREEQLRQSADESLARAVSEVVAGSGTQFDSIKLWPFNQDTEGWTGNGAPTLVDGWLRPANHSSAPWVQSPIALEVEGSAYRFVKLRLKRVGAPTWKGLLQWITTVEQDWDAAKSASAQEPVWDANGVATIDVQDVAWWPATIDAIRLQVGTAQTVADYYLIDYVAVGRPQPGASVALVQEETQARIAADAAEAGQRTALAVQMRGNYEGSDVAGVRSGLVASERDARIDGDGVNAQAIQLINARMPDGNGKTASEASVQQLAQANAAEHAAMGQQIDQIGVSLGDKADSSVVAQLRSEVDTIDGQVRANSQSLTSLTDRVAFAEGGVAANSSAISGLASTVSQQGDTISAHTQQLTQIGGKVTDLEGKELANSSAISGLTTQVSQQGGRLDSQADQLTRLSSHVDGVDGKANANASAISGLTTRVTANEQGLASQAQQTTRLEAKIVASSPNLLRNPKFTDNWTGWTISSGVNIGNNTWDGTYAFCAGNPNDYRYLIQAVAYSGGANRPVTASVDMYRNSLRGTMFVRVAFYDAADNVLAYSPTANINHPVGEWKRYESAGTVPAGTVQLRIELFTFDTDTNNSFRRAKLEMGATASPFDEGKSVDALASGFSNLNVQVQQQGQSIAANATQINGVQVALGNKAEASVVVEMDARMKDTMTGGGNLLENSRLLDGTQGWDQRWNPGGWTLSASPAGTNWDPQGVLSFGGSRYAAGNVDAYGVWGNKRRIPVVPGKRYFVSSYAAAHRCSVRVGILYMDANGNQVGGTYTDWYTNPASAGGSLANWRRIYASAVAPAGAVYAIAEFWGYANLSAEVSQFFWHTMMQLEEAQMDQRLPGPYSPGGAEGSASYRVNVRADGKVGGIQLGVNGGVSSFDVVADVFRVSSATGQGQRTEYSDGHWRCFYPNGQLATRVGWWP